jgi:hypothetical protein
LAAWENRTPTGAAIKKTASLSHRGTVPVIIPTRDF